MSVLHSITIDTDDEHNDHDDDDNDDDDDHDTLHIIVNHCVLFYVIHCISFIRTYIQIICYKSVSFMK